MKGKITFNKSGSGNKTARLIIPVAYIELMEVTEDEREVNITYENGKLIIEKSKK
ncbi:PemI [Clostridium sp. HBUAS56017]|uniref:PemI n=1 Tax=Clostridium sp. HBUAS56017 TaxID=2571128 RepID=UPI001177B59A|nr:PemI [Clostridium sp. HBUAS56017]